ncbi:MAG: protein phosphatase 2C domain-containing protein [Prevotella sp.]|nr:protein phosphatase 2C domain-containing protein [Prevotella sp.]
MKKLLISASCQTGSVRSHNEDMVLVAEEFIRNRTYSSEFAIDGDSRFAVALADGLGGCNAGEVASLETLTNLRFFVSDMPKGLDVNGIEALMNDWLESVNLIISSKGHVDSSLFNMGTTLVAMICYDGRFFIVSCGDSRLYRLRDGELAQLTADHSLKAITGDAVHSCVVTNCIGANISRSWLDFIDMSDEIHRGDIYMMCSDGLNDMLPDFEIRQLLLSGKGDADTLCAAAIEAGGYDNVSVCVIRII